MKSFVEEPPEVLNEKLASMTPSQQRKYLASLKDTAWNSEGEESSSSEDFEFLRE